MGKTPTAAERRKGRPATLDRWSGERRDRHRAMLLWVMQAPGSRSNRAVARAMGISESCCRNWKRDGCWVQRSDALEQPDADALDVYRRQYMTDFGTLEIPHVAPYVVQAIGNLDLRDPAAKAAHDARVRMANAVPIAEAEVEQQVAQAVRKHKRDAKEDAERHIRLVDASLGTIAKRLKADEIKVSVRDIPLLLECRDRLVKVAAGVSTEGPGVVVESARLKHAKETGGNVLQAMHEDALELSAILGAMLAAQDADLVALAAADAATRQGDATG